MDTPGKRAGPGGSGRKWNTEVGPFLTLGLQLALSVVVFFFLGRWLDNRFNTAPWLMITGLVIGIVGGFISFFRTVIALGKREEQDAKKGKG
jgi:F0F1-type ATP synthase assembly protein I